MFVLTSMLMDAVPALDTTVAGRLQERAVQYLLLKS